MDYRNLPFKFSFGGLDIVSAPENVPEGKFTRLLNVRYRREGTLEGRPGTEDFQSSGQTKKTPLHGAGSLNLPWTHCLGYTRNDLGRETTLYSGWAQDSFGYY